MSSNHTIARLERHNGSRLTAGALAVIVMLLAPVAAAQEAAPWAPAPVWIAPDSDQPATEPMLPEQSDALVLPDPFFAGSQLYAQRFSAPARAGEKAGTAVFDPGSHAWYAAVNGTLARWEEDGRLTVIADGIQGTDLDVRFQQGLAVSREPDDTIVLHATAPSDQSPRILASGSGYFHPRFSPDARSVLLAQSHPEGGRMMLVSLDGHTKDLGQGYGAAWHPDGNHIVFHRIEHDGRRILASYLAMLNITSRKVRRLPTPTGTIPVEPAISPDGRWLTYFDQAAHKLVVTALQAGLEEVSHDQQ